MTPAKIHVGIGGWTFPPWRGRFYPPGLPHAKELAYAAGKLTAIEINGTFYRTQSPASFAKWRAGVPDGFVFSVKAPRAATYRAALGESGASIERFMASGIVELGDRLGPILWQLPPTRRFEPDALAAFLALLPKQHGGLAMRHVIEARHDSFVDPAWSKLLRDRGVSAAIVDSDKQQLRGELTSPVVYARLQRNSEAEPEGYATDQLDAWARRVTRWASGQAVDDLSQDMGQTPPTPRECFVFFISGEKARAPDAAQAFMRRLRDG